MLTANFSNLPPAYVEAEEFDCLHDEGVAYAQALKAADWNLLRRSVFQKS